MNEDPKPAIKVLFQKLTTLIMSYPKNGNEVMNTILMVGGWSAVVFASLIVMIEGEKLDKAFLVVDRITNSMNRDMRKQVIVLRGLKRTKESEIITPNKEIIT